MSETLENQQETAEKMFYAAVGAPVVIGQKAMDFFNDTSLGDLEEAGREFASHLQESKVVEQIQETVDMEQFQEKVDLLREQLETLLTSWRDQFDPTVSKESVKIEVDNSKPKKATSTAKKTASTAKKTTTKKSE